ncbi:MAG: 50S ribosomal protein L28 [Polyangia bacterium]|jgi:large subunit ribosomal protein L28|nr:50S ribosomal protein L28 [Polyangia bacterium]
MAAVCELCGKGRNVANIVSHSNIKTKSVQRPNLKRVRAMVDGTPKRIRVCTRCLRSGLVTRPMVSSKEAL